MNKNDNYDLKIIKKKYGEDMGILCRHLFPTLLEKKGLLSQAMMDNFTPNHFLYEDIVKYQLVTNFRDFICNGYNVNLTSVVNSLKKPKELLKEAGYILYECTTNDEIESFRKYYIEDEELCTFDEDRLEECYVFFAVKKDVDCIKRENFHNPARQDEYGTSVISIQFDRDSSQSLSIKNRYNHTVDNPDSTFSNNLDNIIPGLTDSFEKEYGLRSKVECKNFNIPNYTVANDGKFYKYNYRINGIYYCPNNIIIDKGVVQKYQSEQYTILDYFILDNKNKTISLYDQSLVDSFPDSINEIQKINIENSKNGKIITIIQNNNHKINITLNKEQMITCVKNDNIIKIEREFLYYNKSLIKLEFPSVEEIGDYFCYTNEILSIFRAPNLKKIGDNFCFCNEELISLYLPSVEEIGDNFCYNNEILSVFMAPNLRKIGDNFCCCNEELISLYLSSVEEIGDDFCYNNEKLAKFNAPSLKKIGDNFCYNNEILSIFRAPNLRKIGYNFCCNNEKLSNLYLLFLENKEFGLYYSDEEFDDSKITDDCMFTKVKVFVKNF